MTHLMYVWGPILDRTGVAVWHRSHGTDIEACPADGGLSDEQPSWIGVHVDHRGPLIGEVHGLGYLHDQVFALAEVDADRVDGYTDGDWYWSANIRRGPGSRSLSVAQGTVNELSLTRIPATVGLRPVRWNPYRPSERSTDVIWRWAAVTMEHRHRGAPLRIQHFDRRGQPIRADGRTSDMTFHHSAPTGRVLSVR